NNFNEKLNTVKGTRVNTARPKAVFSAVKGNKGNPGNPQQDLKDKGVIDSGCSRHMTGNKCYLTDYEEIDGGFVAFRGNSKRGKITGKDFKLTDESQVLLKVSRKDNMYNVDLRNVVPQGGFTCLFAKATPDESNLWNRRLGHVNFKTMNKLDTLLKQSIQNALTKSMNNKPVIVGNQSNGNASTKACDDAREEKNKDTKDSGNESEVPSTKEPRVDQEKENDDNSTNNINTVSSTVNATSIKNNVADNNEASPFDVLDDLNMPDLEDIGIFSDAEDDDVEADMTNLDIHIRVSPIAITKIHKDHPVAQIIEDIHSTPQTRRMSKNVTEHGMFSSVQQRIVR
ncbi:hypothetical protein Tco_0830139, partial [Tanacetum coccineum]